MASNSVSRELSEAVIGVCSTVSMLVDSYEETRQPDKLDALIFHVDRLRRVLLPLDVCSNEVLEALGVSLSLLEELDRSQSMGISYEPEILAENCRGRPRIQITQEQLEYLLQMGFSGPHIADILSVSLSTVRRRMHQYRLSINSLYSIITDQDLDILVADIKQQFPNCGYRLMHGHLLRQGHRITQARVREVLHRVDPEGVVIRWTSAVQRRKYSVASPLSLWHVDGNHKLIRCADIKTVGH